MDESLEKLNEKLINVMTILQGNSGNIEQLNHDLSNLKKDVQGKFDDIRKTIDDMQTLKENEVELREKVPYTDMTSLVLELKSCIKSYRSIEKNNSTIEEKLNKVYGRNFFDH